MAAGFKTATVNASDVPSTQTNFPSYVDLDRLGVTTLAEAQSIRVYADEAKTVEWAREIVSVDEMHVKVPSFTSTVDIYVDWDGVRSDYAVGATYGRNNVWGSEYKGVYHFDPLISDSTSNVHDLTNFNSVTQTATALGQGADGGTTNTNKRLKRNENIDLTNATATTWSVLFSINTLPSSGTNLTIMYQVWRGGDSGGDRYVQFRNTSGTYYLILRWADPGSGWVEATYTFGTAPTVGQVIKVDATRGSGEPATDLKLYVNGVLEDTVSHKSDGSFNPTGGEGTNAVSFLAAEGFQFAEATIDEGRWSNVVKSANWITTEYNNQSDEATFWGTWTDAGGGAAQAARRGVIMMG